MIDITLADLTTDDVKTLNSIKPDNWTSIMEIHEHYVRLKNCHSIKAVTNNQLVGIGTGIVFDKTSWLAHIIVAQEFQKKGIGNAIVKNRIEYLHDICLCKTITLTATDQGYPLYKKIGFIDEGIYRIMKKTQPNQSAENISKNITKIQMKHYNEVFAIDKIVSGEDRSNFLYPVLENGYVFEKDNQVLGFYLSGFGDSGISALSEEAGLALLTERIKEEKVIFIPEENDTAYKYLSANGFTEVHRIFRMILGEKFERNPRLCYSRIGGFAG